MKNQGRVLVVGSGMAGEQGPGKVIPVPERRYYSLIDKVYNLRNLYEAWKAVRRNRGAAGVDLTLHPEKTRITSFGKGFDFLGFTFKSQHRAARKKALERFKEQVRQLTRRQQHRTLKEVITALNPVIRGWGNYFRIGHMKGRFEALDQWIRMRLRSMVLKRKAQRSRVASAVLPNKRLAELGLVSLLTLLPGR